jgi:hypothetical protein
MVANERGLSPLRVAVVLFSIQIIFFLYHVALSNPGYVNPAAVVPSAIKVSRKMGKCMEVAAWWLVYGRSPSFKVHSVMIPSVVEVVAEREDIGVAEATEKAEDAQTRSSQSGGDKGPPNREETNIVVADIVGSHGVLPMNYLLSEVHVIAHLESELTQPKSRFQPETEVVAERAVIVVADIVGSHGRPPMNYLLSDVHVIVHLESELTQPKSRRSRFYSQMKELSHEV